MPTPNSQLKKLEDIVSLITESLTRKEFTDAFENVVNVIIKVRDDMRKEHEEYMSSMKAEHSDMVEEMSNKNTELIQTATKTVTEQATGMMKRIEQKLETVRDGLDGANGINGRDGKDADEERVIREVLNKLPKPQDGKDADISVINELENKIKQLNERITNIPRATGRMGTRRIPMLRAIDLTADVNGSATTFTVPRDTVRVHLVWSTQFPVVLRPDVDFTLSGQTLTLVTAQVGTMQSGQTVVALIETLFYA